MNHFHLFFLPPTDSPIPKEQPDEPTAYNYRVRHDWYQRLEVVEHIWKVCYCDAIKISEEYLYDVSLGKTQIVGVGSFEYDKYLGDETLYNERRVDPHVIIGDEDWF